MTIDVASTVNNRSGSVTVAGITVTVTQRVNNVVLSGLATDRGGKRPGAFSAPEGGP